MAISILVDIDDACTCCFGGGGQHPFVDDMLKSLRSKCTQQGKTSQQQMIPSNLFTGSQTLQQGSIVILCHYTTIAYLLRKGIA